MPRSPSKASVREPELAKVQARFTAMVLLPTPPLPPLMASTRWRGGVGRVRTAPAAPRPRLRKEAA